MAECNVGGADRLARLGIGVAATGAGLLLLRNAWARAAALGVGAIGLATGLTRYCPVNAITHRDTCHMAGA